MPGHLKRYIVRNKFLLTLIITLICIIYFITYSKLPENVRNSKDSDSIDYLHSLEGLKKPLSEDNFYERVSIIIREFETFDHAIPDCIDAIKEISKELKIFIVADTLPYPPIEVHYSSTVILLDLSQNLLSNFSNSCPLSKIDTEFVFIIPSNVKISDWKFFKSAAASLRSRRNTKAIAVQVSGGELECSTISVDFKQWTLSFQSLNGDTINLGECNYLKGEHGLFLKTDTLKMLTDPFARPFPFSYYVQSSIKNWKVRIMKSARLELIKMLYSDPHSSWKRKRSISDHTKQFYKKVGIRKEILKNGLSQFYGCTKETERCFGTVLNDMPAYLYEGRWTPPCCLKALRETAAHTFKILEASGVRYWLEGGSLLGAARHNDIIPWDYDIDIGIYKDDISKCLYLVNALNEPFIDDNDFVWEKAREGDFFRVQYSEKNHLHVDIYPFYSRDGVMTKDTWFPTHRQDTEFSETYLKPLTTIQFAGLNASAPNNVKKFLEYKFGQGVIDNPKYPNYQKPV